MWCLIYLYVLLWILDSFIYIFICAAVVRFNMHIFIFLFEISLWRRLVIEPPLQMALVGGGLITSRPYKMLFVRAALSPAALTNACKDGW
jgi:hypothetical protein